MTSPPAHGDGRTIFLIDGWSAYRRSLRLFVEAAGYRVVGEADSISAAAAHVGLAAADVVILDPGWEWRGVRSDLARLRDANHAVAIVLLTATPLATDVARQAHGASVDAQLTKEASPEEILATVAIALRGNLIVLSRGHPLHWERPNLTRREHEILTLVAKGFPNHVIGEILWVDEQSVRFQLVSVFRKLGVRDRAAAVQRAEAFGLLAPWEWPDSPPAGEWPQA
jgi:DNA-binding NarL/FixJ family response regulator